MSAAHESKGRTRTPAHGEALMKLCVVLSQDTADVSA